MGNDFWNWIDPREGRISFKRYPSYGDKILSLLRRRLDK